MIYDNWTEDQKKEYIQRWQVSTGSDLMKIYGVSQRTITSINKHLGLWVKEVDGKESPVRKAYRRFKNSYPLGTVVYHNVNGKKRAFIITDQGRVRLHIYNWKQAGREIPEGYVLGFKDLNPENNELENLVLKTRADIVRDNVKRAYPNAKAKTRRFKPSKPTNKGNTKDSRRKAKETKENRLKIEREWQARSKKNREVKQYPSKPLDLSGKIRVVLDHKTTVYVKPGTDIEAWKRKYLKTA